MQPPVNPPNPPNPLSLAEVEAAIDRNNNYLVFAQKQIEQDRSFFKHLLSLALGLFGLAGLLFWNSTSQMRTEMKNSLETELKIIRAEARQKLDDELKNVRSEVQ